jgi:kynurenine formamidase
MLVMTRDGGDERTARLAAEAGKTRPAQRFPVAEDILIMSPQTSTHVDALCHVIVNGQLYNGFSEDEVRSRGARKCGIENMGGVVNTGYLLDIPGSLRGRVLGPGDPITSAMLKHACEVQGIRTFVQGATVLIRTGWRQNAPTVDAYMASGPGITEEAARWLADQDVAIVGADTMGVEQQPSPDELRGVPAHEVLLNQCGIYLVEQMNLEDLAIDRLFAFAFILCPLPLVGASGSPVRPIAVG